MRFVYNKTSDGRKLYYVVPNTPRGAKTNVHQVINLHQELVDATPEHQRIDRLCEVNVLEQVANVCYTTIVQNAWKRGQALSVHGWIYSLRDGLLRDLGITVSALDQIPDVYRSSREIVTQYHAPQDSV